MLFRSRDVPARRPAASEPDLSDADRAVLVLYAADRPLDPARLQPKFTHVVPADVVAGWLATERLVLTDQYAPVDNLMAGVFRTR